MVGDGLLLAAAVSGLVFAERRQWRRRDFHIKLITILTSTVMLRELFERTAQEISRATGSRTAWFFAHRPDGHFVSGGTPGHLRPTLSDIRLLESYFRRSARPWIFTKQLQHETEIRRLLGGYRISFTLPLVRGDQIIGFLFLGAGKERPLSRYAISLVSHIKDELAIAVQNAAALEAVKELNAHLQQRVDSATEELRSSNTKLHDLDQAKDEFVSMASHQLRTPLTSVKGYISMVLEGDAGKITKAQRQLLNEAFTSSERMVHLIGDFLNVSRIQTGKFVVEKSLQDLGKIVRQEAEALRTTAEAHELKLRVSVPPKPVMIALDEDKIRQVIMNFIDNAIYYSKPQTEVTVYLSVTPRETRLEVRDRGIGVPLAQQTKLFTKFFRADNARKQRPDGTGVGLYLAKQVIDGHGGRLVFVSKEGEGSTFGFRLPLELARKQPDDADDGNHQDK
jgi:signal transduction histidine kinase